MSGKILVVDDEERIRSIVSTLLREEGYLVGTAANGLEAIEKSSAFEPHVIIADLQMPHIDGLETIERIKEHFPKVVGVILTAHGTIESAVQAIKRGIYDYITKPFDNEQLFLVVRRALELYRLTTEVTALKHELKKTYNLHSILGNSRLMQNVRDQTRRIAQTDATVFIEGESGTGKELAARAIHYESKRKDGPLVIIDCGAVPANLIETEFFGHEKGAFTDAREQRIGRFEEAHTGSIFLDEISELPLAAQTKLLRVLQEREFTRVGGKVPIKIDVRVIAATNKNLEALVREGNFREDLYYRLNVLQLRIPLLREHREDIPLYVQHFLLKHKETLGKQVTSISDEALQLLKIREWKGNIRELENVVQRAMLNASGSAIDVPDLEFLKEAGGAKRLKYPDFASIDQGLEAYVKSLTEQTERQVILKTLQETNWNRTLAAEKLKISRKTLFNKMQLYGIEEK